METIGRSQPWAGESAFEMIDVGGKEATYRRATARGTIRLASDAYRALCEGRNPKGDVLKLAEVAAIQAAKRTSDLIPLCHPLPLDQVRVRFERDDQSHAVTVFCEASTFAKTGVEMEALCGVNGALLAIYDLSKAVNPVLTISEIRLERKEGGKHGTWQYPSGEPDATSPSSARLDLQNIRCGVLTVSDRCAQGQAQDRTGPAIVDHLSGRGALISAREIIPDQIENIRHLIRNWSEESGMDLVIVTGGTGIGPRDVTPEALAPLWSKHLPGFGELLRARGSAQTPMSYLSRSEAGLVGRTLVILLPGSPGAVKDGLATVGELIPHALAIAQGGKH